MLFSLDVSRKEEIKQKSIEKKEMYAKNTKSINTLSEEQNVSTRQNCSNIKAYQMLSLIYGIGRAKAMQLCSQIKIKPQCSINMFLEKEQFDYIIRNLILLLDQKTGKMPYLVNDVHRFEKEPLFIRDKNVRLQMLKIEQLIKMKSYRGIRHKLRLPVNGQRTRTNAATARQNILSLTGARKTKRLKKRYSEKEEISTI